MATQNGMMMKITDRELLAAAPATEGLGVSVVMRPMEFEDRRVGWYIDHPDFYCDIEPDEAGIWSVFFRDKNGKEAFGEKAPNVGANRIDPVRRGNSG